MTLEVYPSSYSGSWSYPTYAYTEGGTNFAVSPSLGRNISSVLELSGFNFSSISMNNIINSVTLEVGLKINSTTALPTIEVQPRVNGNLLGSSLIIKPTDTSLILQSKLYEGITLAQLLDSTFTAVVTASNGATKNTYMCFLDYVSFVVDYAPSPPPEVLNITVNSITTNSATVTCNTNEEAQCKINYGYTSGQLTMSTPYTTYGINHNIVLQGLIVNSTIYYSISATGTTGTTVTSEMSFNTLSDSIPPTILSLTITTTTNSATINLETNELSTCIVHYGTLINERNNVEYSNSYLTHHTIIINGLLENTQYFFDFVVTDAYNNSMSFGSPLYYPNKTKLTGYKIHRTSNNGETWDIIAELVNEGLRTYTDIYNLEAGTVYSYKIEKFLNGVSEKISNIVTVSYVVSGAEYAKITLVGFSTDRISDKSDKDVCTVTFKSDQDLLQWEARASGEGVGQGSLVGSGFNVTANTDVVFTVENEELIWGDTEYRINIYGQNAGGAWNLYEY